MNSALGTRHSALGEPHQAVAVSVLVPAKDEADNLAEFCRLASEALGGAGFSFER